MATVYSSNYENKKLIINMFAFINSTRKDSLVVGGSNLYLFNTMQKTESGGYDAAVTYWKKFVIPTQEIVRTIKDNTKE